jgi:hypothetical protein
MRSLVAGPFDVVPLDPLEPDPILVQDNAGVLWMDQLGLLCLTTTQLIYAIQVDGRAIKIGSRFPATIQRLGWNVARRLPMLHTSHLTTYRWRLVDMPSTYEYESNLETAAETEVFANPPFVVLPDRKLASVGHRLLSDESGGTEEHAFSGATPGGGGMLSYAGEVDGHHLLWAFNLGADEVFLYDATSRAELVRTSFGSTYGAAAYSRKHDCFFVLREEAGVWRLYIYANEPIASSVSPPAFSGPVRRGSIREVAVTVLGSNGEPCRNRLVTFSANTGLIPRPTVMTDSDGEARTIFRAPFSAGASLTLTATVGD